MLKEHDKTVADMERIANDKLREELVKTQMENRKLEQELKQIGFAAEKTDAEIKKLHAEILQLTTPWKTPQFYLALATIVVSFGLAIIAGYGVLLQRQKSDADWKEKEAEIKAKQAELKAELEKMERERKKTTSELSERIGELAKLEKSSTTLKDDLKTKIQELHTATRKRTLAEGVLVFSAKHTMSTYDELKRQSNPESLKFHDAEIQFAADQLNQFIDSLGKKLDDPLVVAELLRHETDDVRRLAALLLSRLPRGVPEAPSKRQELARYILEAMTTEKKLDCRRLQISAVARIGKDAAAPLLENLDKTEGEIRLNIVRGLGDLKDAATPHVIDRLTEFLTDGRENKLIKRQAVLALGNIGAKAQEKAEQPMMALLPLDTKGLVDDPENYFLCREAVTSLGNIGASKDETATRLLKLLSVTDVKSEGRREDELVMEVLITLGKIGKKAEPASNAIAQIAAKTSKQDVLEEAAIALARIGKKEEVEKLLADDSRQKKIAGIVALTAMTDSRKEILENAIFLDEERKKNGTDKKKLSGDILTPSVILTVRKRGADAAPVLADALSLVHHVYVRENLAKALGEIGNGSEVVVNALVEGLLDTTQKNPYVQIAAIRSLEKLASKADAAKAAMIRVAEDPVFEERVRLVAQTAVFANIELDKSSESQKLAKESMYDEGLNKYYKIHPFAFEKNYLYRIDLISKNFDSFLYLKRGKTTIAFDDDSGGDLNARLFYKPQDDEKLEIWATTYPRNALGDYQLEIRKLPASPTKK